MASTRLVQLAEDVLSNTKAVEDYFRSKNLPTPSFDVDGPSDFGITADAQHVEDARLQAMESALELHDLLQGPLGFLRPINNGVALQAISRWNIALKVPIEGDISFEELAQKCDVNTCDIRRIMRYAIAHNRLFKEVRRGYIAHSLASKKLAEDHLLQEGLWILAEQFLTAAPYAVEALEKWKDQEPNHTAVSLALGTDKGTYDYMDDKPELAKRFALAMTGFARYTSRPTAAPRTRLLEEYPWAALGSSTVVDVGGSRGTDAINIATKFPSLSFVVQDLPKMLLGAAEQVPPALQGRIRFVPYSFFTPQTVTADAYLIKQCFHNWPDHYCVRILQNQIPALKPGARLIVCDSVVPEPGVMSLMEERMVRAFDVMMLTNTKGREREREEWVNIFKEADPRFKIQRVETLRSKGDFGPSTGLIEVIWEG